MTRGVARASCSLCFEVSSSIILNHTFFIIHAVDEGRSINIKLINLSHGSSKDKSNIWWLRSRKAAPGLLTFAHSTPRHQQIPYQGTLLKAHSLTSQILVSRVHISVSELFMKIRLATGNYLTFPVSLFDGWMIWALVWAACRGPPSCPLVPGLTGKGWWAKAVLLALVLFILSF